MAKRQFWKVSVYDNILGGYVIKQCSIPTRKKANAVAKVWKNQGYEIRVTPQIPELK